MNEPKTRNDTDFTVTLEQIARLERSLLSLREYNNASPEVMGAIAAVQYREIVRLRAELDAAIGFAEATSTAKADAAGG